MKKGIIAAGIICLMLSGCGSQNNIEDELNEIQSAKVATENENAGDSETTADESEHKVNFTVENSEGDFQMTADLVIDTTIPAKVVTKKVNQVTVDEDYLISLSKALFDGGKYEVLTASSLSSENRNAMINEIMDATEKKAEEFSGLFEPSPYYEYLSKRQSLAGDESQEKGEYSEGQVIYSGTTEENDGDEQYVCYYERAFIKGDINGKPYIMEYAKEDWDPSREMYNSLEDIMIYPMDGRLCLGANTESSKSENHEDNKVTYKDALSMAEQYIQQLGLADYSLVSSFDCQSIADVKGVKELDGKLTSGESIPNTISEYEKNGYRFIFTPEINGMNVAYCSGNEQTATEYDSEEAFKKAWLQPVVQIDVDVTGLRGICMNRVYMIEEDMNDDSNLISFEKANEIAKQMYSETYTEQCDIGDIRLEYIVIQYDEKTVMAPAWVYYEMLGSEVTGARFAVNALDGSVVHFNYNASTGMRWVR